MTEFPNKKMQVYDLEERTAKFAEEINETKYWFRILTKAVNEIQEETRKLWKEAQELNLIFQKIINSLNKKV